MTEPETAPEIKYATFSVRILAATIDLFIIMLVAVPVINGIINLVYGPMDNDALQAAITQVIKPDTLQTPEKYTPAIWDAMKKQHVMERSLLDNVLQFLFIAVYTLPFWFRYSATPGKLLFRIQIQDASTHNPMSREQAVKRFFGYILSFIPFTLGFLWMIFNKEHRGFHDMVAKTVVVVKQKSKKLI